jgi:integrase
VAQANKQVLVVICASSFAARLGAVLATAGYQVAQCSREAAPTALWEQRPDAAVACLASPSQVAYADVPVTFLRSGCYGSVHHTHRALHKAFVQAVRWEVLARNPCDGVTPPQAKRSTMKVLNQDQVTALLIATKDRPANALYVLAVTTGMRQGELSGLRWEDVDLEASKLIVRRALQRQNNIGLVFVEPKIREGVCRSTPSRAVWCSRLYARVAFGEPL